MKKLTAFFLAVLTLYLNCFFVSATNTLNDEILNNFSNASVVLLDFDNWDDNKKYIKSKIYRNVDENSIIETNMADIINISSLDCDKQYIDYALQLVDNGSVLLIQNKGNINTCSELAAHLKISMQEATCEINENPVITLGYVIRKNSTDYSVSPVFATVLKPNDANISFDIQKELLDLKASDNLYIDPIDLYCRTKERDFKKSNMSVNSNGLSGALQMRNNYYRDLFGYGYLYGKGRNAVWGEKSGYTLYGYIEMYAQVVREKTLNGYRYDAVETLFTATGRGNKYVEDYKVYNLVNGNNSIMVGYSGLNIQNKYTYTSSYSITGQGVESTNSISVEVNPGAQQVRTTKTYNKVLWSCNPNSNLRDSSWWLEGSSLTKTPVSSNTSMYVGFEELVVDNWGIQYTSPCAIAMAINY